MPLDLVELADRLSRTRAPALAGHTRLQIPAMPEPFVAPRLSLHANSRTSDPLTAEVILISSPAAVGKTTAARYLAARSQLPVLNLAATHVSTNTLAGLLAQDFVDSEAARRAFHKGDLPVIVDALDEGRLRSGDPNFEQFLETTWELLLQDRSITDRPKIVLLGRGFASELVETSLQLNAEGLRAAWLELEFFDAKQAAQVIELHAAATVRSHGGTWVLSQPAREVIDAFFAAIAAALSLDSESLWSDMQGHALAGYAPVLAAIGSLLAREPNPIHLKNALAQTTGPGRAWDVIERVAAAILAREHEEKVRPQLESELKKAVPPEVYDPDEQLTYLVQQACGRPVQPTARVKLQGADAETYRRMVDQQLPDHPFLQDQELKNDVLKSIVLAYGITNEIIEDEDAEILYQPSRQPFLWRSVQAGLPRDERALLRGEYFGPVLNSLWNDPVATNVKLSVTDDATDPGFPSISLRESGREWLLQTMEPLEFYEQLRECDIDTTAELKLHGHAGAQGISSFDIRGNVTLIARNVLTIEAAAVRIDGQVRIFASSVVQPGHLVVTMNGSRIWLGGGLKEFRPWRDLPSTLSRPTVDLEPEGDLERLVEQSAKRIPSAAPVVVYEDNYMPADFRKSKWLLNHPSGDMFPKLLRLMVSYGFARADMVGASGADKLVRLHFELSWRQFLEALRAPTVADERLRGMIAEARQLFERAGNR